MQLNTQQLQEKWSPVLDHEDLPKITDRYKRAVTAVLLENQEQAMSESRIAEGSVGLLTEAAPANNAAGSNTGRQLDTYDPVLISMMCKYFECSKQQVGKYLELIHKEELTEILEMYGTDKNQIKRMIK